MDPFSQQQTPADPFALTRRHFVRDCSMGLGAMALASLSAEEGIAGEEKAAGPLAARDPHFAPSVKNVIFLHMAGSPPHLDLFDYKPEMEKINGIELPDSIRQSQRLTTMTSGQAKFTCVAPMFQFKQVGEH